MLALDKADVYYGRAQALFGVSLVVRVGEVVALAGRNGAGKTTVMRTLAGQLSCQPGALILDDAAMDSPRPERISRAGIAYVPADRQVFPTLTVLENLRIAQLVHRQGTWTVDGVLEMFPRLGERRGAYGQSLSGGEQQMLAIARALLCAPRILLLDEPTEGLAPIVVSVVVDAIKAISAAGTGVLMIEQNFKVPELLAHRFIVMDGGRNVWEGDRAALDRDRAKVNTFLSL